MNEIENKVEENKSEVKKNLIDVDLSTSSDIKENIKSFFFHPLTISLLIIVIVAGIISYFIMGSQLPQKSFVEAAKGQLDNPKVVIETYEDFVCPVCQAFNATYDELIKKYEGKSVKFVFMNYPFLSTNSTYAAEASMYANDRGKFWEYKDKLFEEQKNSYDNGGKEDGAFITKDKLVQYADEIGLSGADLRRSLDGREYKSSVEQQKKSGDDKSVDKKGTPSIFINGNEFVLDSKNKVYRDVDSLSKVIDAELSK
ncbi:MAG: thioredoxin domain-containing protein [bacterium]